MMAGGGKFLLLTKITLLLVSFNRPKGETKPDCSPKYFSRRSAEAEAGAVGKYPWDGETCLIWGISLLAIMSNLSCQTIVLLLLGLIIL